MVIPFIVLFLRGGKMWSIFKTRRSLSAILFVIIFAVGSFFGNQAMAQTSHEEMTRIVSHFKLMNYYPAAISREDLFITPYWDQPEPNTNLTLPQTLQRDFKKIAAMGANSVRIGIQIKGFGWPTPKPEASKHLEQLIDIAQQNHLKVKLSLFNFNGIKPGKTGHYGADNYPSCIAWVNSLFEGHKNDPRILYVDLMNEMRVTNPEEITWARAMLPALRDAVGSIPLAISVSTAHGIPSWQGVQILHEGLGEEVKYLDIFEYHAYDDPKIVGEDLANAKKAAAPWPLFIGETGWNTRDPDHPKWTEEFQDKYIRTVERLVLKAGLPPAAPWIYSDAYPGTFGAREKDYSFGLVRLDGSEKPSARTVREIFTHYKP